MSHHVPTDENAFTLRLVRMSLFALLFTPLIFWKPLDFFFDSTKAFFIMGISEILLIIYLWLIALHTQWRPRITRIGVALFVYIVILILSSVFGVDPFYSFWSNTVRIEGVLMWLHLGVIFVVLTSVFRTERDWQKFFFLGSLVGVIVSLIFLFTTIFPSVFLYSKGGSTLGNSTFFGTYLIFCTFFSSMLAFTGGSHFLKRFGIITTGFFLLVLFMTPAQAAVLSMVGGMILAGSLWMLTSKISRSRKIAGLLILIGLSLLFFLSLFQLFQTGSFVRETFIERSSGGRFVAWEIAWKAFQERPVLGWGVENFPIAFFANYDPCFGSQKCGFEFWYDRAHNKVLDTLVESGIVGFVSYLFLFILSISCLWQAYRRKKISVFVPILVTACLAVYFVQNLAEFDIALTLLFFLFVLGYVDFVVSGKDSAPAVTQGLHMSRGFFASIVTLAMPLVFYHTVVFPIVTNRTDLVVQATNTKERLDAYETQMNGSPIGRDYRRAILAGETVKWILGASEEERERFKKSMQEELALGIQALEDTVHRSPNYVRGFNLLGFLYQIDGQYFQSSQYQKAEDILQKSLLLNKRNQQTYAPLAAVYLGQEKVDEAFTLLQQAVDLDPEVSQSWFRLLVAIKLQGSEEVYLEKQKEILNLFPDLQDEVDILSQVKEEQKDQLFAFFY